MPIAEQIEWLRFLASIEMDPEQEQLILEQIELLEMLESIDLTINQ